MLNLYYFTLIINVFHMNFTLSTVYCMCECVRTQKLYVSSLPAAMRSSRQNIHDRYQVGENVLLTHSVHVNMNHTEATCKNTFQP